MSRRNPDADEKIVHSVGRHDVVVGRTTKFGFLGSYEIVYVKAQLDWGWSYWAKHTRPQNTDKIARFVREAIQEVEEYAIRDEHSEIAAQASRRVMEDVASAVSAARNRLA